FIFRIWGLAVFGLLIIGIVATGLRWCFRSVVLLLAFLLKIQRLIGRQWKFSTLADRFNTRRVIGECIKRCFDKFFIANLIGVFVTVCTVTGRLVPVGILTVRGVDVALNACGLNAALVITSLSDVSVVGFFSISGLFDCRTIAIAGAVTIAIAGAVTVAWTVTIVPASIARAVTVAGAVAIVTIPRTVTIPVARTVPIARSIPVTGTVPIARSITVTGTVPITGTIVTIPVARSITVTGTIPVAWTVTIAPASIARAVTIAPASIARAVTIAPASIARAVTVSRTVPITGTIARSIPIARAVTVVIFGWQIVKRDVIGAIFICRMQS